MSKSIVNRPSIVSGPDLTESKKKKQAKSKVKELNLSEALNKTI